MILDPRLSLVLVVLIVGIVAIVRLKISTRLTYPLIHIIVSTSKIHTIIIIVSTVIILTTIPPPQRCTMYVGCNDCRGQVASYNRAARYRLTPTIGNTPTYCTPPQWYYDCDDCRGRTVAQYLAGPPVADRPIAPNITIVGVTEICL
jgi:hypothetical protein